MNRGKGIHPSPSVVRRCFLSFNLAENCRAVVADLIAEYEAAESADYLNPSPEKASES